MKMLRVGNGGKEVPLVPSNYRTKAQYERVGLITEYPGFAFACSNPFDDSIWTECFTKHLAFAFVYYTYDVGGMLDVLHIAIIEPSGRVSKHVTA